MHVHQLQHFAFRDHVGRFGQDLHDAHVVCIQHHLEGARIQEVAHQHAGGVAEGFVGGGAAAAQGRFVDHVVVQQGRGVDELHHGRQVEALFARVAERACHEQQQRRPQPLAAGRDDVLRNLADQRNASIEALGDHTVDFDHVAGNQVQHGGGGGGVGGGNWQSEGAGRCEDEGGPGGRNARIIGSRARFPGASQRRGGECSQTAL
ncbi:hypothetical protein D9M72_426330 [compost metagenome]